MCQTPFTSDKTNEDHNSRINETSTQNEVTGRLEVTGWHSGQSSGPEIETSRVQYPLGQEKNFAFSESKMMG